MNRASGLVGRETNPTQLMGTESEAAWDQVWNEGGFRKGLLRQFWKELAIQKMAAGTLRAKPQRKKHGGGGGRG